MTCREERIFDMNGSVCIERVANHGVLVCEDINRNEGVDLIIIGERMCLLEGFEEDTGGVREM